VTVFREDPNSGLYYGIARPVGSSLQQIRNAAARNLAYGLGIVGLALLGILPLSARMTRNLGRLDEGARRLAKGDLDARVPVRSRDEFGSLAETFNRMAQELGEGQRRLVEQERLRKEVEIGRKIQQDLLPRQALELPFAEVKGLSIPALEVGGDFFNYFLLPGRQIAVLVGDVSGKGVPAALLMANIQATLRARLPLEKTLGELAERVDAEVEATTPSEVYVTLFVGIVDPETRVLQYINAGHNPPFVLLGDGTMTRLDPTGRPLGLLAGGGYDVGTVELGSDGVLFLYTDRPRT